MFHQFLRASNCQKWSQTQERAFKKTTKTNLFGAVTLITKKPHQNLKY